MRIVFIGPPGAGKGTQAQRVSKHYSIPHVSTGDTLRDATQGDSPLGKIAAQQINAGNLVPDEVVLGIVRERLAEPDCANGVLLDGFPRTQQQAQSLDDDLQSSGISLDVVLALDVEDGQIRQRLVDRARGPDDNPETIQHRLMCITPKRNRYSPIIGIRACCERSAGLVPSTRSSNELSAVSIRHPVNRLVE